ncbi:MAG: shikimate dehydrogenase, partial [Alphaproteobacteria bacterium]|nr:shikimate dehydrogenase [Alphaproteobacteria bacterium]
PARAACVIGWPAKQSRSPKLHGYWIRKYGIDGDYRIEERRPEEFAAFVTNLAGHGYVGANVTMPHKDAAYALSEPDERARAVGAANTLWLAGGRLKSTNTDVEGFIAALDERAPGWDKETDSAVVLGAGGAGRAIVYGFLTRGIKIIHVVNRTLAKAEEMRQRFGPAVRPATWEELPRLLAATRLLSNATSLGMAGKDAMTVDLAPMPAGGIVGDAVNVPLVTPLLEAARHRGFRTTNGLDMLLHQAVRGFELWFGVRPEVTEELRAQLAADIAKG